MGLYWQKTYVRFACSFRRQVSYVLAILNIAIDLLIYSRKNKIYQLSKENFLTRTLTVHVTVYDMA